MTLPSALAILCLTPVSKGYDASTLNKDVCLINIMLAKRQHVNSAIVSILACRHKHLAQSSAVPNCIFIELLASPVALSEVRLFCLSSKKCGFTLYYIE